MYAYKLEYDKGGLYRPDAWSKKDKDILYGMLDMHRDFATYPTFFDDFDWYGNTVITGFVYDYVCGCNSLESLRNWFGKYFYDILAMKKVDLCQYEYEDLIVGRSGKQVAFIPKNRVVLDKTSFANLL